MKKVIIVCVCLSLLWSGILSANELRGDEVLDKVERAMDASSVHMEITMKLYNSAGDSRERSLEVYRKKADRDMALIKFLSPATVKGTAFLSLEEDEQSDMYLYLPALGSERRIAGSQRNGNFVGSDLTYNDLTILGGANFKDDYSPQIIEHKDNYYKLELIPTDQDIDYKYVYMWVDTDRWYPIKMEFYNSREELFKILTTGEVREIAGYLSFKNMTMEDTSKGSKTELIISKVEYDLDLEDSLFTVRNLKR